MTQSSTYTDGVKTFKVTLPYSDYKTWVDEYNYWKHFYSLFGMWEI